MAGALRRQHGIERRRRAGAHRVVWGAHFARRAAIAGACVLLLAFVACQLPGVLAAKSGTPLPTISPGGGNYSGDQSVTISDSASGVTIYYTTDGSTPTTSSARYSGPIAVAGNGATMTIKAIAVVGGRTTSSVAVATYTISYAGGGVSQAATPQFSPAAGGYSADQSVAISDATSGAVIYYTTDGSTPTTSSTPYSGSVAVAGNGTRITIRAMAVASGLSSSAVVTAAYTVNYGQVSTPNVSPSGGSYSTDQSVSIADATAGAIIHYTVTAGSSGTTPTTSSPTYSGPISVAGTGTVETIEAMGSEAGMANSTVAVETLSINYAQVSTPQIAPPTGSYSTDQSVYLSTSTAGATIHYTLTAGTTGIPPTTSSPSYAGPISVASDGTVETIEALAAAAGMANSTVSTSTLSIVYPTTAPTFGLAGGTYSSDQSVSLADTMAGAAIYYTTNGSTPTTSSNLYSAPISVAGDLTVETIKAIAVAGSRPASPVAQQSYAIVYPAATPTFSVAGGMYGSNQSISIAESTPGVTVYYTTDGSTPTTSSPVYAGPISVSGSGTTEIVEAIAESTNRLPSPVAAATYSVLYTPTGLLIGSGSTSSLPVTWNSVAGAASYALWRSTSSSFAGATQVYSGASPSFTDTSVASGTIYYYEVEALDAAGASPLSSEAIAATLGPGNMPVLATVSPGATNPATPPGWSPDYWVGTKQPGWIDGGYRYVVFDPDYQNSGNFAIAAYDAQGNLVNQWLYPNRYITSITLSSPNIVIVGQYGTTTIPWSSIQM